MGVRLAKNLKKSDYQRFSCGSQRGGPAAPARRGRRGLRGIDAALDNVDVVILAVPDTLIGKIAAEISPKLRAGVMVMTLDAAAPFAGHLPDRPDLVYFVAHPCHRPSSTTRPRRKAVAILRRRCRPAINHQRPDAGPESAFDLGEDVAKVIYQPILRSYRLTVEQMAILEPGLSETVCATLLYAMKQAMDETVRRGAGRRRPAISCWAMNILGAVIFKEIPVPSRMPATRPSRTACRVCCATTGSRSSSMTRSRRASAASPEGARMERIYASYWLETG
jgi:hypothetical protein